MIKIEKGNLSYSGNGLELLTEVCYITRRFYQKEILSDEDLNFIVRTAKISDEEMDKRTEDGLIRLLNEQIGFLDELINIMKDKEDEN